MTNLDRESLTKQIKEWNSLRMDLFEISLPDENLEFSGVIKFFFRSTDNKLQTKCLRVSSTQNTAEIIQSLVVKFFPLCENPNFNSYRICEVLNNKERKLKNDEYPLLVQLKSMKSALDAIFILKYDGKLKNKSDKNKDFLKRRWSIRKESRKSTIKTDATNEIKLTLNDKIESSEVNSPMSHRTDELSTERIQNDNCIQDLIESSDKCEIVKIYGEQINREIPYINIQISMDESCENIIRKFLDAYNLPHCNVDDYSLTLKLYDSSDIKEQTILPGMKPLSLYLSNTKRNIKASFELRPKEKPVELPLQKEAVNLIIPKRNSSLTNQSTPPLSHVKNFLVEIEKNGLEKPNRLPIFLPVNFGLVVLGSSAVSTNSNLIMLSLPSASYSGVAPYHCVLWMVPCPDLASGAILMCSSYRDKDKTPVTINNRILKDSTDQVSLRHGDVIKLGHNEKHCLFRVFTTWKGVGVDNVPDQQRKVLSLDKPLQRTLGQSAIVVPPPVPSHQRGRHLHVNSLDGHQTNSMTNHRPQQAMTMQRPQSLSTCSPSPSHSPSTFAQSKESNPALKAAKLPEEPNYLANADSKTSSRKSKSINPASSAPSVSDKLPCQLAYAPATLNEFLDWIINRQITNEYCPLGSSLSIYLMLRAICRQCDRWEAIEIREERRNDDPGNLEEMTLPPLSARDLQPLQWRRRRRQILSVLIGAIERLSEYSTDSLIMEGKRVVTATFADSFRSLSGLLSNSSQLLHLVTHDIDLSVTFQAPLEEQKFHESFEDRQTASQAWQLILNKLANLTENYFEEFSQNTCDIIKAKIVPSLMKTFVRVVIELEVRLNSTNPDLESFLTNYFTRENDIMVEFLSGLFNVMTRSKLNSGIIIQLFVRILHNFNCDFFNQLISGPLQIEDLCSFELDHEIGALRIVQINTLTPLWGTMLDVWLRKVIYPWFDERGFLQAAECYLLRLLHLSELLCTDVTSVETLYNVIVDLVRLNSVQVRKILEYYRIKSVELVSSTSLSSSSKHGYHGSQPGEYEYEADENEEDSLNVSNSPVLPPVIIPAQWIDFVVSGVKQVADKILAEEEYQPEDDGEDSGMSHSNTTVEPQLLDRKELNLPFLLPDDSYPSEVPLSVTIKDLKLIEKIFHEKKSVRNILDKEEAEYEISIQSLMEFMKDPITNGWSRLSLRPINMDGKRLCWSVYLSLSAPSANLESDLGHFTSKMVKDVTLTNFTDIKDCNDNEITDDFENLDQLRKDASLNDTSFRTHEVLVVKSGNCLGLTILAAKSYNGEDLGIFIKTISPNSPCNEAKWIGGDRLGPNESPLMPGDRLLMVNNKPITGLSQEEASKLVAEAGNQIKLTVTRDLTVYSISSHLVSNLEVQNKEKPLQASSKIETEDEYDELKDPQVNINNDYQKTNDSLSKTAHKRHESESPTETYGEFLTTAKLLRNMRDELAKCFNESNPSIDSRDAICRPKLSTYRNLSKMKGSFDFNQRVQSSVSFANLFNEQYQQNNNTIVNKNIQNPSMNPPRDNNHSQPISAMKNARFNPHRNSMPLSRVTKSLVDLSLRKSHLDDSSLNTTHEFPASASLFYPNVIQKSPINNPPKTVLMNEIPRGVIESTSSLHDRLMNEQRERSKSADKNRLSSWIRISEDNEARLINAIS